MMWMTYYGDLFMYQDMQSIKNAELENQNENIKQIEKLFKKAYNDNIFDKKKNLILKYSIEDSYILLVLFYQLMLGPAAPVMVNVVAGRVGRSRVLMENRVLVTIAINDGFLASQIQGRLVESEKKVEPTAAISDILNRLEVGGLIESIRDEEDFGETKYFITKSGLYHVLTLNEFWDDDTNLSSVILYHDDKLPLILGKYSFFKELGWTRSPWVYKQSLRTFIPLELKMTELIKPIPSSPTYSHEEMIQHYNQMMMELGEEIKTDIEKYPMFDDASNQSLQSLENRITIRMLGIADIMNTKKIFLPTTIKNLKDLMLDHEIRDYINEYFELIQEEYRIKNKRVQWWKKKWKQISQNRP